MKKVYLYSAKCQQNLIVFSLSIATIEVLYGFDPDEDLKIAAIAQGAVQEALKRHNLQYSLDYDGRTTTAILWHPSNNEKSFESDKENIEMLDAYLQWLSQRRTEGGVGEASPKEDRRPGKFKRYSSPPGKPATQATNLKFAVYLRVCCCGEEFDECLMTTIA